MDVDFVNVVVAEPVLFVHPPDGSVTFDIGTVTEPVVGPPEIANGTLAGAAVSLHAKLTFKRIVTVVGVSETRVQVTFPYRKCEAKTVETPQIISNVKSKRLNIRQSLVLEYIRTDTFKPLTAYILNMSPDLFYSLS